MTVQNLYITPSVIPIIINSPLELFEVMPLITVTGPLANDLVFSLTNFVAYSLVITSLVLGIHFIADNASRLVPSYWSVALETVYASVLSFSRDQLGSNNGIYTPFAYSLFWLLLVTNLAGNIPYGFTLTASAIIAIGLSITIWLGVTIIGLVRHNIGFFAFFIPAGTPLILVPLLSLLELVSYLARAVSLGVRVFANIVSGHLLLGTLSTFLFGLFSSSVLIAVVTLVPFGVFTALIVLEIAVSVIQAYVFVTLACSYISDAINLH